MENSFFMENSQSPHFCKKYPRKKSNFVNPLMATVVNEYGKLNEPFAILTPLLKNEANPYNDHQGQY